MTILISGSLTGAINGRRNSSAEVDRRCTYRPWMSLLSENDSIVSTVYSDSKPLIPVSKSCFCLFLNIDMC